MSAKNYPIGNQRSDEEVDDQKITILTAIKSCYEILVKECDCDQNEVIVDSFNQLLKTFDDITGQISSGSGPQTDVDLQSSVVSQSDEEVVKSRVPSQKTEGNEGNEDIGLDYCPPESDSQTEFANDNEREDNQSLGELSPEAQPKSSEEEVTSDEDNGLAVGHQNPTIDGNSGSGAYTGPTAPVLVRQEAKPVFRPNYELPTASTSSTTPSNTRRTAPSKTSKTSKNVINIRTAKAKLFDSSDSGDDRPLKLLPSGRSWSVREKDGSYKCFTCLKKFSTSYQLFSHKRYSHGYEKNNV